MLIDRGFPRFFKSPFLIDRAHFKWALLTLEGRIVQLLLSNELTLDSVVVSQPCQSET